MHIVGIIEVILRRMFEEMIPWQSFIYNYNCLETDRDSLTRFFTSVFFTETAPTFPFNYLAI